jgi:hypothetical protein
MFSFRHTTKLLFGVGSAEDNSITPARVLVTSLLLAFCFLGTVSGLLIIASLIING